MNKKAFTLVELLAVIVILAIVLSIAIPRISSIIESAEKSSFVSSTKLLIRAVQTKLLEDNTFDITTINKGNLKSILNIDDDNYSSISFRYDSSGKIFINVVGTNKWSNLITYGTYDNINITDSIVNNGLLVHLDASNTNSYPGSGTNWNDLSGNVNKGILTNGAAYNSSNGGVIRLDGSDDMINFGNNSTLYSSYNTSFTQEYLIKVLSNAPTNKTIFRVDDWSRISVEISTSRIEFLIGYASPVDQLFYNTTINYNQWYHIVVVWSKLNQQKIYLNGSLVAERTPVISNYSGVVGTSGGANLGRGHSNPYHANINADYAVFRHYNRVLNAVEIEQNFNVLRNKYGL